jgi:ubiquinone/menaquinone biosynthesis C-methylase UbiE
MRKTAAYDGLAEWYDSWIRDPSGRGVGEDTQVLRELLGRGPGRLLDQGCGGGRMLPLFAELGWSVVGIDESDDQLRVAEPRADAVGAELVHGDATELPFADESFDAVAAVLVSTDIEPWERLVAEASRVLRPGGRFVHVGTHPSFVGPHSVFDADQNRWIVGKGYRERRRQFDLPAFRPEGIRIRVGAVHAPLDDFLNAIIDSGLRITLVREGRKADPPWLFGVRAEKR